MNFCKKFHLLIFLCVFYLCFFPVSGKKSINIFEIQKNVNPKFHIPTTGERVEVTLASPDTSLKYRGVIAADVDGDNRDELIVDFGSLGIWLFDPYSGPMWILLYGIDPDFMIAADYDADDQQEIFAYFDSFNAIHQWDWVSSNDPNGQWTWNWVKGYKCDYMFSADIEDDGDKEIVMGLKAVNSSLYYLYLMDNYGNPSFKKLYDGQTYAGWAVDFGDSLGWYNDDEIVIYHNSMSWWNYYYRDPNWTDNWDNMTVYNPDVSDTMPVDIDGDYEEELVADLNNELWVYDYSSNAKWEKINGNSTLDIREWYSDYAVFLVSFSSPNGLWKYCPILSPKWQILNGLTPDWDGGFVEIFNPDGDLNFDVAVDYSNKAIGLWKYNPVTTPKWKPLNGNMPIYMVRADLNGDGKDELTVKFSFPTGLWKYDENTFPKWQRINGATPD